MEFFKHLARLIANTQRAADEQGAIADTLHEARVRLQAQLGMSDEPLALPAPEPVNRIEEHAANGRRAKSRA
jgi:hypothetical protein